MAEPTKAGARNNADDRRRIREMRGAAKRIHDLTVEMEPDDDEGEACVKADFALHFPDAIAGAMVIKAAGDYELDVLLVPFGGPIAGKDTDGQYFDDRTDIQHEYYKTIPAYYYHAFTPEGKPQGDPEVIGKMTYDHTDAQGHWYKAILDRANEYARRVWEAAKRGKARASSGSINHIARALKNGWIKLWPVVEGSLIDAEGKRQPANAYAVAMPAAKATKSDNQPEAAAGVKATGAADNPTHLDKGVLEMDEKELLDLLDKRDAAKAAANAEAQKAAEVETLRKENETMKAKLAEAQRLPGGKSPTQAKFGDLWKYDNSSSEDLMLVAGILNGKMNGNRMKSASPDLLRALAVRTTDAAKTEAEKTAGNALKAAGFAYKADEVMQQDLTGYGDEWVGVGYGTQLWQAIRNETNVLAKIPQQEIPQGMETFYDPTEGADPTWYKVAEVTDNNATTLVPNATVTASKSGTGRSAPTLAKAGARVLWSGELDEDSLIPMASELRRKLALSGAEQLEHAVIDGDTETGATTNINDIGGTPAGTEMFMTINGFRKLALVTNTANSVSAANSFSVSQFLTTVKLMGSAGADAIDVTKVGFILDLPTMWKALELPEVLTRDVNTAATVEGGRLTRIFGYDVMASPFMNLWSAVRKSNSAGKVDQDTTANNAYGSILAVRWDRWKFGWKRRATVETERIARADAYEIVALMRFGLKYFSTEASAISYYVAVA